jgi:hypothetical protein
MCEEGHAFRPAAAAWPPSSGLRDRAGMVISGVAAPANASARRGGRLAGGVAGNAGALRGDEEGTPACGYFSPGACGCGCCWPLRCRWAGHSSIGLRWPRSAAIRLPGRPGHCAMPTPRSPRYPAGRPGRDADSLPRTCRARAGPPRSGRGGLGRVPMARRTRSSAARDRCRQSAWWALMAQVIE